MTVAVVAPAVPLSVTSPVAKSETVSLKTTVKLIGDPLAGSARPVAWLIVTVGAVPSYVTVLSALVEALLPFPAASVAALAGMPAITVPSVIPLTATLYVLWSPLLNYKLALVRFGSEFRLYPARIQGRLKRD